MGDEKQKREQKKISPKILAFKENTLTFASKMI
jgi:hypothetical protein